MREQLPEIEYADTAAAALDDATIALFITDWPEITELDEWFDAMVTTCRRRWATRNRSL